MAVGIIGMGYVGLPLAVAFTEAGRDVVALDIDRRKVPTGAATPPAGLRARLFG